MLENIKSVFFKIILYDYINEGMKLKLIKYNKNMQKLLNINIINYMRFSERYIVYETKEKGKEYDSYNNELIYEGGFLNGRRNGKGKVFSKGGKQLEFEGEYLNGKRNGKGKEYLFCKLKFEGEYLNGKRWNGKSYGIRNNIIYEIINGKGYIKEYFNNGILSFEGEYLNGQLNGKVKKYDFLGNLIFEGEYLNGIKWNGKKYDEKNNIIYEINNGKGNIKKKGFIQYGYSIFIGEYLKGETKEYYENGQLKFEGEYLNGKRNGEGKEYYEDGKLKFEGEYIKGERRRGKEYDESGNLIFEG